MNILITYRDEKSLNMVNSVHARMDELKEHNINFVDLRKHNLQKAIEKYNPDVIYAYNIYNPYLKNSLPMHAISIHDAISGDRFKQVKIPDKIQIEYYYKNMTITNHFTRSKFNLKKHNLVDKILLDISTKFRRSWVTYIDDSTSEIHKAYLSDFDLHYNLGHSKPQYYFKISELKIALQNISKNETKRYNEKTLQLAEDFAKAQMGNKHIYDSRIRHWQEQYKQITDQYFSLED